MQKACPTQVRLWRWRSNPLRRRSDVVESWLLLAAWILAVVGGAVSGLVTAVVLERGLAHRAAELRSVPAVVVADAPAQVAESPATDHRVWATVRWTAPDGSARTDQARVPPDSRAGTRVSVWTDGRGALAGQPLSHTEVVRQAIMSGALVAVGVGGAVLGGAWLVRSSLDRRRMEDWAADWERFDARRGWKTG